MAINGNPKGEKGNTALILTPSIDGMKETGCRLVRHGKISLDTLNTISRNLHSKEQYLMIVNQFINNILSQHDN